MSVPRGYARAGNRQGVLAITLSGSRLGTNARVPRVRIDGALQRVGYGENVWALRAGPHRVQIDMYHRVRYGKVSSSVDVAPDTTTRRYYVPPHHQLAPAGFGPDPQPRAGAFGLGAYLVLGLLVVVAVTLVVHA